MILHSKRMQLESLFLKEARFTCEIFSEARMVQMLVKLMCSRHTGSCVLKHPK
jgi:hypothetical protein